GLCAKSPGASTYGCVGSCPANTQECSGACVDLQSSADNCGECGKKCDRPSATATCKDGNCLFTCTAGTHECNSQCVADLDTTACGASCTVCPSDPANHVLATCGNGTCGTTCE